MAFVGPAFFDLGVDSAANAGFAAAGDRLVLPVGGEFLVEEDGDPKARRHEEGAAEDVAQAELVTFLLAFEFWGVIVSRGFTVISAVVPLCGRRKTG